MTEFKDSQIHGIPRWQSNKMRRIIVDRWQETWTIVETRNKRLRRSSALLNSNGNVFTIKG